MQITLKLISKARKNGALEVALEAAGNKNNKKKH